MRDESKFEVLIVPNIFSFTNGAEGEFVDILCAETYDEAIDKMNKNIEEFKENPNANAYHYDIWEYDEEAKDNVINEWVFDYQGKEIKDLEEWLKTLLEEELKEV